MAVGAAGSAYNATAATAGLSSSEVATARALSEVAASVPGNFWGADSADASVARLQRYVAAAPPPVQQNIASVLDTLGRTGPRPFGELSIDERKALLRKMTRLGDSEPFPLSTSRLREIYVGGRALELATWPADASDHDSRPLPARVT